MLSSGARAEDQAAIWSEFQLYKQLSPNTRLNFLVNPRFPGTPSGADVLQVGANFDLFLGSILRYYAFNDPNELTRKYVMIRLGYRYFSVLSGDAISENRPILEVALNFYLPESIMLTLRNRFDFRFFVNGVFAFQYRARLRLEREFRLGWGAIAPYVADEVFYDGRFSAWVRNRLSAGVGFVDLIANDTTLDLGYIWQADWPGLPPANLHIIGINFTIFLS